MHRCRRIRSPPFHRLSHLVRSLTFSTLLAAELESVLKALFIGNSHSFKSLEGELPSRSHGLMLVDYFNPKFLMVLKLFDLGITFELFSSLICICDSSS